MTGLEQPSFWWIVIAVQFTILVVALIPAVKGRRSLRFPEVTPECEPQPDVDAATAAILLRDRRRAGVAAILEQAVGGSVRIHRTAHGTYRAEYVRLFTGPRGIALQTAIFGTSVTRGQIASIGPRTVRTQAQRDALRAWFSMLASQPVVTSTRRRPAPFTLLGIVVGALSFFWVLDGGARDEPIPPVWLALYFLVSVVVSVILLCASLLQRRQLAVDALVHLEGLRSFMMAPEADRLAMLRSRAGVEDRAGIERFYERLLPYAVAMRIDPVWARVVAHEYAAPPVWLEAVRGDGFAAGSAGTSVGFSADDFSGCIAEMCGGGAGDSGGGVGFGVDGGGDGGSGDGDGDGGGGDGGGGGD